jgi:large subunit ribosomal protein L17
MRHGDKVNNLSRTKAHRDALMKNMAAALIMNKKINTTLPKAKSLRQYVEKLITKSKTNSTHSRRVVFSYLQNKEAAKEIFDVIGPKVGDRPGGYTRIMRTGFRLGDAAETAIIELVDFNEVLLEAKAAKAGEATTERTRKTRRGRGGKKEVETTTPVAVTPEKTDSAA